MACRSLPTCLILGLIVSTENLIAQEAHAQATPQADVPKHLGAYTGSVSYAVWTKPADLFYLSHTRPGVAHCTTVPSGRLADCATIDALWVEYIGDCVYVMQDGAKASLNIPGGDTVNYQDFGESGGHCEVQRCGPEGGDPEWQIAAGEFPTRPISDSFLDKLRRDSHVYSYRCNPPIPLLPAKPLDESFEHRPGRTHDYYTSSRAFKMHLKEFFGEIGKDWTVLELGAYRGYTTKVLSEVFAQVIAIDASTTFLQQNRNYNKDATNIVHLQIHSRIDGLRSLHGNSVQVVLVDADHDYESVRRDVDDIFNAFSGSLKWLLFDDFFSSAGIRQVVAELVSDGKARVRGGLGKAPPWSFQWISDDGRNVEYQRVHRWEGIALEILDGIGGTALAVSPGAPSKFVGRWYHWLERNLLCSDGRILFQADGQVSVPWGTGTWRFDDKHPSGEEFEAVIFDWQGSPPEDTGMSSWSPGEWILRITKDAEKFLAIYDADNRRMAAGISEETFESIHRRLFISVDLEWCRNAQECYAIKWQS